ncbi:hypothetical protein ACFVZQ_11980, partial [Streptomyces sp. NPDC059538]
MPWANRRPPTSSPRRCHTQLLRQVCSSGPLWSPYAECASAASGKPCGGFGAGDGGVGVGFGEGRTGDGVGEAFSRLGEGDGDEEGEGAGAAETGAEGVGPRRGATEPL